MQIRTYFQSRDWTLMTVSWWERKFRLTKGVPHDRSDSGFRGGATAADARQHSQSETSVGSSAKNRAANERVHGRAPGLCMRVRMYQHQPLLSSHVWISACVRV